MSKFKFIRKRSLYKLIILITIIITFIIIFILGSATEDYYIVSDSLVKTKEYTIDENVTGLEFDLIITITAQKTMTKLAFDYDFPDDFNITPFFENKYDGGDDDTLRAHHNTKLNFHCITTNTTFWYMLITISFNDEYDVYHEGQSTISYRGVEKIPTISVSIIIIVLLIIVIFRKAIISDNRGKNQE